MVARRIRIITALVLFVVPACTNTSHEQVPPETGGRSTSVGSMVAGTLERAPGDCEGPAPRYRETPARFVGQMIGTDPLWAGPYARLTQRTQAFHATDARRTRHGWRVKILWVMSPRQHSPVIVTAETVEGREPVWFALEGAAPRPRASFDPAAWEGIPQPGQGAWKDFPSYAFFPRAACYRVRAGWHAGSWEVVFGFGR